MKISELILHLNHLRKKHGNIDVIGYAPHFSTYDVKKENVSYQEPGPYTPGQKVPTIVIGPGPKD